MMQEMWTILRILNWTKAYFEDKGIESPRLDAELLLCAVLGMRRIDLYTHLTSPWKRGTGGVSRLRHAPGKAGTRGLYPRRERVSRLYLCRDC